MADSCSCGQSMVGALELHPQVVDVDAGTAEARIVHQRREEW
jgi:hypothetical protein